MAVVVSDTSPIIALAQLGHLELLRDLFGQVLIPPAVDIELRQAPPGTPAIDASQVAYFRVQAPGNLGQVQRFLATLDPGEAEALALAMEIQAEAVLMDEEPGRRIAKQVGLSPLGTLGILLQAKQESLVATVRPLLDRLENELGFFISADLRSEVLKLAGELEEMS